MINGCCVSQNENVNEYATVVMLSPEKLGNIVDSLDCALFDRLTSSAWPHGGC